MRIYLIGFMGCGKSYWGKVWAEKMKYKSYDIDNLIEEAEGTSIEMIFDKKGEEYFRKKETAILKSTLDFDNCIVSCGGGTPCFNDNMQWMNNNGVTIYLQSQVKQLVSNILNETDKRPLIKNLHQPELTDFVEKKLKERIHFYRQSSHTVDINQLNPTSLNTIFNQHQTFV